MNNHSILNFKSDILVVDDTRENLLLLATMLSDAGYKIRKAINGTLALGVVEVVKPDLILLDINMPELDGYEVCRRLKSNPDTANIPVIFISAYNEVLDKVKAFEIGGIDYITKPFEMQEVLIRVRTHLTISHQQKQLTQQNTWMQLLLTTTKAIGEASDFNAALEATLTEVCEKIGWEFGEFWLPNSQATVFELGTGWYASNQRFEEFRRKSKPITFATNREFLRQICVRQESSWLTDVSIEPGDVFQRNQLAREVGLKACWGVPIVFKGQVLAVLMFLKQEAREPEPQLVELVNSLAIQLSALMGRKHSESALRESQEQFEAMAANIPGCVYRGVVHPNGRMKLLYASQGEYELSGLYPQEAIAQHEPFESLPPDRQTDFYEALKAAAESHEPITQEYSINSPTGERKWVRNSARYTLMGNGDVIVDGVAIDISDCLRYNFASNVTAEERLRHLESAIGQSASTEPISEGTTLTINSAPPSIAESKRCESKLP
ncbi:MAG: response regulator [Cyanobacteriota bacterium]